MVYLKNTIEKQELFIERNDGLGIPHTGTGQSYWEGYADGVEHQRSLLSTTAFTENGNYVKENGWSGITVNVPTGSTVVLEEKSVTISADTTNVIPSSGYDGMSKVIVDAEKYAQDNYDSGVEDGYSDGYSSGSTDGYQSGYTEGYSSGYTSGHTDGVDEEKAKLSATTFTANTAVTIIDGGYSAITVNVPQTGHTDQELEEAYESGHTEGMEDQKALLSSTAFTENGSYSSENGWSGVSVNVDTASTYNSGYTSGHTDGISEEKAKMSAVTFTANTAVTLSDGSYSAVTVNVPQTGYTQEDLDDAYASGYTSGETVGENTIIATFSSMTATTNGVYGSSAHPLSSITVNVPQSGGSVISLVDSIYTQSMNWDSTKYIDTKVTPTTATTMRIGYVGAEIGSDRVIGYDWMDSGRYSRGWRYFNGYEDTNTVDLNTSRKQGGSPTRQSGVEYDITLGNNYLYDNINESYIVEQGDVQSSLTPMSIRVDVGSQKVKFVEIKDNGVTVFDGQAAIDSDGNIGLYDSVSMSMVYNSGLTMAYEGTPTPIPSPIPSQDYQSGYTDGQNSIISTFTAMTATTNGVYGSSANPLSSITVNVPQSSGATLGHPSITINSNGTRTKEIGSYQPYTSYNLVVGLSGNPSKATIEALNYPSTGYFNLYRIGSDSQLYGYIDIYYENGQIYYDDIEWTGGAITDISSGSTNVLILMIPVSHPVSSEGPDAELLGYYDGMSAITITTNVDTASTYQSGYTSGFTDGYNSGYTDGHIITGTTAFTTNGIYRNSNGWSAITVSVPQSGSSTGTGYMNLGKYKSFGYDASFIKPNRRIELDMKVKFDQYASVGSENVIFSQFTPYNRQYDGGLVLRHRPTDFGVGIYGAFGVILPTTGGTPSVSFQSPNFLLTAGTWYDMGIVCTFTGNTIKVVASIDNEQVANFSVYSTIHSQNTGGSMFTINDPSALTDGIFQFADLAIKTLKVFDTTDNSTVYSINYSSFYNDFI